MLTLRSAPRPVGPQDLTDLLGECHQRIRRFVDLAHDAGLRSAAPTDQVIQACADVKRYFTEALPLHVADEEESIEPRLRGLSPALDRALEDMTQQHRDHAPKLRALLDATARVRRAPHDHGIRGELAAVAMGLKTDLEEHLALEERAVFPAIRELLSHDTQASIVDELRRRRGRR